MRPPSIVLFEKLYVAVIVIGLAAVALSWSSISAMASNQPGVPAAVGSSILVGALIFGFLVPILLLYFIARRASTVAKWIFVVLAAFSLYSFVSGLANPPVAGTLFLAVNAVSTLLTLYCAWLLFKPDAKAWLDSKGANAPADPTTFE